MSPDCRLVQRRLESLKEELQRLLNEIEQFKTIVYCKRAAACLLDGGVIKVLAGSLPERGGRYNEEMRSRGILIKEEDDYVFARDYLFHTPSTAAKFILARYSANGKEEWKDHRGRSINTIHKLS